MSNEPSSSTEQTDRVLSQDLLDLLVCPMTRSALKLEGQELVATVGGLRYPIRDGIPVLLIEEAVLPQGVKDLEAFRSKFADVVAG